MSDFSLDWLPLRAPFDRAARIPRWRAASPRRCAGRRTGRCALSISAPAPAPMRALAPIIDGN